MNANRNIFCLISILTVIFLFNSGCQDPAKTKPAGSILAPSVDLGTRMSDIVTVYSIDTIAVEGYAIVGGLQGTGSAQCPPQIRQYLQKYIRQQLPLHNKVSKYIDSINTAVVYLRGQMPASAARNVRFDIEVAALQGTQTTSLEGGTLWGAELFEAGKFGLTFKVIAEAQGPVYINKLPDTLLDKKLGFVLAGGKMLDEYSILAILKKPNYLTANAIRNRLIERFGDETAEAKGPEIIRVNIPAKYHNQKKRFVKLLKALYLTETRQLNKQRINTHIRELATLKDKQQSEIALEAIGKESLEKLTALLNSSNEQVRLAAARCMLYLEDDAGLNTMAKIAADKNSQYRLDAMQAIRIAGPRNDATAILRKFLADADFDICLAAYEHLRKLDDFTISSRFIADSFHIEQIAKKSPKKLVYVFRKGHPRIVIFGAPIYCKDDVFIQSDDKNITINASKGQKFVSIIRKSTGNSKKTTVKLKSSFELSDIIRTLCEKPLDADKVGLNVSYDDVIAILRKMSLAGAINAEFRAGGMPKISQFVK